MIMWMKSHKVFTSVTCLLLVAALAGTALLLSNHLNTATSADETAFGTYSGISENDTVTVTMADGTEVKQYAGTRDPWLWPFSSDSIWNMPIGEGATLTTNPVFMDTVVADAADITNGGKGNKFAVDIERVYLTSYEDTQYNVYRTGATGFPVAGTDSYGNIAYVGNEGTYTGKSNATRRMIKSWIANNWTIPNYYYDSNNQNVTIQLNNNTDVDYVGSTGFNYAVNKGKAYWPTNLTDSNGNKTRLVVNDGGNQIAAIVQPNRRTVAQFQSNQGSVTGWKTDPDNGRALFPYDGTYDKDVPAAQKFIASNMYLVDLYSTGEYGTHGGSELSSIGGSIREGELTGGDNIHHALKLNIDQLQMFYGIVTQSALDTYNPSGDNGHYEVGDVIPGYTWPALKCDSQTSETYTGSNPFVSMGSLLALSENDVTEIKTQDAYTSLSENMKKLVDKFLYALQYYGCYIVDNTKYTPDTGSSFAWSVSDLEIDQVLKQYNVILKDYNSSSALAGQNSGASKDQKEATKQYCAAMDMIVTRLRAVTNNTAGSIGGGGTPTKPLAPEIVPLEGITVADQTIPLGSETTLDVVCQPTNASVQDVTYSLADGAEEGIIEICDGGKKIKGITSGSTTIKVTSDESGFTDTCTVTVAAYSYDVNGDGKVDAKDYAALSKVAGKPEIAEEDKKQYDITDDGAVNENDLDALKALLSKGGSAQ